MTLSEKTGYKQTSSTVRVENKEHLSYHFSQQQFEIQEDKTCVVA